MLKSSCNIYRTFTFYLYFFDPVQISSRLSPTMAVSLLCSLCTDPCSSVMDLRRHLGTSHNVANKKELSEHIKKSMEEQIKKKEEAGDEQEASALVVTLDQEEENEEEHLPPDFAKEEDVQKFFKLKGEKLIEAISKVEPKKVDLSLSFEEVMEKLANMKRDIDQLEIPDVEETQLKAEFEASRRTSIKKIEPKSSKPPTRTTMFLCPR